MFHRCHEHAPISLCALATSKKQSSRSLVKQKTFHYVEQPAWDPVNIKLTRVVLAQIRWEIEESHVIHGRGGSLFPLLRHAMLVACMHVCKEFSCRDFGVYAHAGSDPK